MATKTIFLFTLLSYSIVVSQPFMYILALKHAQLNLGARAYTELRQLIDNSMRSNFKYVVYTALLCNLLLVLFTVQQPGSLLFITAAIALVAFIADILLTLKGNMPINNIINTWTPESYPANWTEYRDKWLQIFQYRQISTIIGFLSLLIGAVFGAK